MYRVAKVPFTANKETIDQLFTCNRMSGEIWNACLTIAKDYSLANCGKWISQTKLQKETKCFKNLHSQSVQHVVHKYLEARDAAKKAKAKGYKNKYPYKKKNHFNTAWVDKAFNLSRDGKLTLSFGNGLKGERRPTPLVVQLPKNQINNCFDTNGNCLVKEVELVFDRKLHFCLTIDDGLDATPSVNTDAAAIDIGEIHTIAAVAENGENIIITGRKMRSIHRLRNKKLAELQKLISRCKKGSRQWRKYQKAKRYVLSKSDAQLKDAMHKTTKEFVDWCVLNQVARVAIGDVEGVQRNTSARKKKNKKRRSRNVNQKLSNWSFGKCTNYLNYKLEAKGISLSKIDESYTTQTCPVCGKRKKTSSRNYTCMCGYSQHRDVHSACNILTKFVHGTFRPVTLTNHTYLRIV